jgi:Tfp pilus assembly protein PilF
MSHDRPASSSVLLMVCGALALAGCSLSVPPPPKIVDPPATATAASRESPSALETTLLDLAGSALERGDLDAAESRYRRIIDKRPSSLAARIGLAHVALARGDEAAAREQLELLARHEPVPVEVAIPLAQIEDRDGHIGRARALLENAIEHEPRNSEAHAALAEVTGSAPRQPVDDIDEADRIAREHPYDAWARLRAGRMAVEAGDTERASAILSWRLRLSSLDVEANLEAIALLQSIEPAWSDRRVVPVRIWADESIRARPGWAMRLRLLFASLSRSLDPLLGTIFLPISIDGFQASAARNDLMSIQSAWLSAPEAQLRLPGIAVGFTERAAPRSAAAWRLGQADLLGQRMTVRLAPQESESVVLIHEVLHLYGAAHVSGETRSIMNPSGGSLTLDDANERIVRLMRDRLFSGRGLVTDVFDQIDLAEVTNAYTSLLQLNFELRELGLAKALEASERTRVGGARMAREAASLDPHLGDVASFIAALLIAQQQYPMAALFYDAAASLYGVTSPRGRQMVAQVERLIACSKSKRGCHFRLR